MSCSSAFAGAGDIPFVEAQLLAQCLDLRTFRQLLTPALGGH
ncbi:hypothetical protein [Kitasatospora sp. MBT66]|nr:hypothetical protein [Kitasatospora sp. MBT66]